MGHPVQNDGTIFFNQHFVQSGILAIRRWIMMKQKHIVRNRHQKEELGPRSQLLIAMHAQQNDYCIVGYLSGGIGVMDPIRAMKIGLQMNQIILCGMFSSDL